MWLRGILVLTFRFNILKNLIPLSGYSPHFLVCYGPPGGALDLRKIALRCLVYHDPACKRAISRLRIEIGKGGLLHGGKGKLDRTHSHW